MPERYIDITLSKLPLPSSVSLLQHPHSLEGYVTSTTPCAPYCANGAKSHASKAAEADKRRQLLPDVTANTCNKARVHVKPRERAHVSAWHIRSVQASPFSLPRYKGRVILRYPCFRRQHGRLKRKGRKKRRAEKRGKKTEKRGKRNRERERGEKGENEREEN